MYQAEYQEDAYFCYQEKDKEIQVEGHPAPKTHYNYFIHKILPYFPELQNIFIPPMVEGRWTGTMNLTEPQAGSDLSAIRSKADPQDDGSYKISGQKIYITYGEHDMAENIIHLVLARTPDAPDGVKGISVFLVPKILVNADGTLGEANDVRCLSIEKKLGIKGSPTAVLQYGENGGATGYLVGEENKGLGIMFGMMNHARFAVGLQGLSIAERAYQQAVDYAQNRIQGTPLDSKAGDPISHHPDVLRLLSVMRAELEAMRALLLVGGAALDTAHNGNEAERAAADTRASLLIPILKGWLTERSVAMASDAVQVHGGMGFIEETGAAQHMRDARILPIYEGTNGIQALDFVGRKCLRDGGEAIAELLAEMAETAALIDSANEQTRPLLKALEQAIAQCQQALDYVKANADRASYIAYHFLMLFGNSVSYWLMVKLAVAAQGRLEAGSYDRYYTQKIATTGFFAWCAWLAKGALSWLGRTSIAAITWTPAVWTGRAARRRSFLRRLHRQFHTGRKSGADFFAVRGCRIWWRRR